VSWLGCVSAEIAPITFDSLSRVPAALAAKDWLDEASFALNSVMEERLRACFVAVTIMRAWCYAMSSAKWLDSTRLDSARTVLFRRRVAAGVLARINECAADIPCFHWRRHFLGAVQQLAANILYRFLNAKTGGNGGFGPASLLQKTMNFAQCIAYPR
jgi:hypothetical protein